MNFFYKRVAQRLVDLDRKRPWLLAQTGIKPSTWSSWEKNDRFPPADRAAAIADVLGVSVEYLVTGKESPFDFRAESPKVTEITQRLFTMDEEHLGEVLRFVNSLAIRENGHA